MAEKKNIKYPISKMGKNTGYVEYEDGSIKIAPLYSSQIDNIIISREAVDELLKSVTAQCQKLVIPLVRAQIQFWEEIRNDYGLDFDKIQWAYDGSKKTITPKERGGKE